uniref:CAP-Gly domain-containing protein n=1 Tax=Angiostrongylus cantonensis TaxID=6313 RepID=A0A158P6T7_ANGCA
MTYKRICDAVSFLTMGFPLLLLPFRSHFLSFKLPLFVQSCPLDVLVASAGKSDRARVDHRSGTVAYVGPVRFAPGEWIGLILDEPLGKNDGSVQGHRYFCCKPEHGLFCKSSKLERIVLSPTRLKASTFGGGEPIRPYALEYGFDIGDRVVVSGGKHGSVRFIGETEFAQGIWAGIELEQPLGKNDGSIQKKVSHKFDIQGKRYFTCKPPYGVFVLASKVTKASSQTPGKMTVVQTKTSLLRQNRSLAGSRESLSSIGRSSVTSSRFGMPKNCSVSNTGYTARIKALEEALREKERHLEQVMRERDMERSEISQLSYGDQAEKIAKLESEKKAIKNVLLEKEKILEDLTFRLEEETISKDCKIEELQKKLASLENASTTKGSIGDKLPQSEETDRNSSDWEAKCLELEKQPQKLTDEHSGTQRTVTADMAVLTNQLSTVEGDNERFKKLLEDERTRNKANNDILETLRNELEKTKEQLSNERFAFEEKLIVANGAVEEKENLLKKTTNCSMKIEKELVKVRAELELAVKEAQDQKEIVKMLTTSNESKETVLVEKLNVLEKDLQAKVKDLHSMEMNNKVLEESVLSLEKELTSLKSDLEVLYKEKVLLQEALEAANTEKATADEILNEKDKEIQWIKDYLMENITVLTAREESMKTTENSLETKTECSFLEDNDLQEQLNALKDNLKVSNEEHLRCTELEKQLKEAEARITEEENALSSKEKEIIALNEHLKTVESKHKNEMDLLISKHAEYIEKLDFSLKSVESANQELLEKSRELELKVADLDENLLAGQQLFNEKEKELSDKMTSAAAQWKVVEANLVEELKEEREISAKLISEKNELVKLTEASELQLRSRSEEISLLRDKIETLTSELTEVTESRTRAEEGLRQQKDAFVALQNTIDSSKLGQDAMTKDLVAANTLSAERLTEISRLQSIVKSLEEQLSMKESLASKLTSDLTDTENRLTKLVEERESDIRQMRQRKHKFVLQLEQSLRQETKTLQELEINLQTKSEEIAGLQYDVKLLTEKTVELEELSRKLRSNLTQKDVELEMTRKERNDAVMAREAAESRMLEERNVLDSNQALANQTKMQYDQLCSEQSQLKEALERLESENKELSTKFAASQSESAAVQLLNEELAASNNLVKEYLKDKEKLKQSLVDQQQKLSVLIDGLEEKAGKEFAAVMGEIQSVNEESTIFEKVEKLKEELAEKQREVTSFQLNQVNENLLVSEAKQKIELYKELEEDWKKKQLRMSEKIDELTTQLEQAKTRTQCDEIRSLRNEVDDFLFSFETKLAFCHSIIADQRRKETALQEKIDALNKLSADSVTIDIPHISFGQRELKPRMYCDICEVFDRHDTEYVTERRIFQDCEKQDVEECSAMTLLLVLIIRIRRRKITLSDERQLVSYL